MSCIKAWDKILIIAGNAFNLQGFFHSVLFWFTEYTKQLGQMALISEIRKHGSWIMVILIALGVGGFILMDMTVGQTSLFGSAQPTMGKVGGTKIKIQDFTNIEAILGSTPDPYARRNTLWTFMVEEILLKDEAKKVGLSVSSPELTDLQYGPEPSSIIQQRFVNQTTQQLDREQLNQIRQQIEQNTADPTLRSFWKFQEREIIKERLQGKLGTLVSKGMYTPAWVAEQINKEESETVDLLYVKVPFEAMDNAEVSLEDADYEAYIEENTATLKQKEERRRIQYLSFPVSATAADSAALRQSLQDLVAEFDSTDNDTFFVERNLGTMEKAFRKKSELLGDAENLFNLPVGSVYGPYLSGNTYSLTKILNRKVIADSVRSRHILLPAQDQTSAILAQTRVDSLKKVIEEGKGTFEELAGRFGTDGTAAKGGDLDYAAMGTMVKPFNDLIFFEAEIGKLYTVATEFGIHLVEVTDRKFINNEEGIQLATISKPIFPSEETRNAIYDEAMALLTNSKSLDDLSKLAKKKKLTLETAPSVAENDYMLGALAGTQQSRDIIKWAFEANPGDVSSVIYVFSDPIENYENQYIIAGLKGIQPAGIPSVADIKSEIEPLVMNRKKGELISKKLQGKTLNQAAQVYNTPVDTALGVNFNMNFIPEIGSEPKFLGVVCSMAQGKVSKPIVGTGGVYVAQVSKKNSVPPAANLIEARKMAMAMARGQVGGTLMESIRNKAKIKE